MTDHQYVVLPNAPICTGVTTDGPVAGYLAIGNVTLEFQTPAADLLAALYRFADHLQDAITDREAR